MNNDIIETVNFRNPSYIGNSRNKKSSKYYTGLLFIDSLKINYMDMLNDLLTCVHSGSVEWALSPIHNPKLDISKDDNEHDKLHHHIIFYFPSGLKDYECQWLLNQFYITNKAPNVYPVGCPESMFKYLVHFGLLHKQQFLNGLDDILTSYYYPIPVFQVCELSKKEMLQYLIDNHISNETELILYDTQQSRYICKVMNNDKLLYSAWKNYFINNT